MATDIFDDGWVEIRKDPAHVARERAKARELRDSPWWKGQLARGVCHYCGRTLPPGELTMDHIVPVARGGKSTRGNVVPCCRECNASKRALTPAEIILARLERESAAPPPDAGDDAPAPPSDDPP